MRMIGWTTFTATGPLCGRLALADAIRAATIDGEIDLDLLGDVEALGSYHRYGGYDCTLAVDDGRVRLDVEMGGCMDCSDLAPLLSLRHPSLLVACCVRDEDTWPAFKASAYRAGEPAGGAVFEAAERFDLASASGGSVPLHLHPASPAHEAAITLFLDAGAVDLALEGGRAVAGGWRGHGWDCEHPDAECEAFLLVRPQRAGDPWPGATVVLVTEAVAEGDPWHGEACLTVQPERVALVQGVSNCGGYRCSRGITLGALALTDPEAAHATAQALRAFLVRRQQAARMAREWAAAQAARAGAKVGEWGWPGWHVQEGGKHGRKQA